MPVPGRDQDADLMTDLTTMVLAAGPEVHERQINALPIRPDAAEALTQIECPVLLTTGTEDGWLPEARHREMDEMAPKTCF